MGVAGPGSGDYARFATSGADFITDSSIYKEQVRNFHEKVNFM